MVNRIFDIYFRMRCYIPFVDHDHSLVFHHSVTYRFTFLDYAGSGCGYKVIFQKVNAVRFCVDVELIDRALESWVYPVLVVIDEITGCGKQD